MDLARHPSILDAQTAIARMLDARPSEATLESFRRLRSLSALCLSVATSSELGNLPAPVKEKWLRFESSRAAAGSGSDQRHASSQPGKSGPRMRLWTTAPDAGLMAAVAPTALRLSGLSGHPVDLVAGLEPLFEAARRLRPRDFWGISNWFPVPADVADAWRILVHRTGGPVHVEGWHTRTPSPNVPNQASTHAMSPGCFRRTSSLPTSSTSALDCPDPSHEPTRPCAWCAERLS
jgi:hypothetical protein